MKELDLIRAVLFDIDGTLFSSEDIIEQIYKEEFINYRNAYGKPEKIPSSSEIMAEIGKPVVKIFEALAPDLTEKERDLLSETILHGLVKGIGEGRGHHYPGTREALMRISSRYDLYAASNGRLPYVESILKVNEVDHLFKAVPFLDYKRIHTKDELVASILKDHGLKPEEALLVGDRTSDRDAALNNGCIFVACRYGHGSEEEWKGAHYFIDSITELADLLSV